MPMSIRRSICAASAVRVKHGILGVWLSLIQEPMRHLPRRQRWATVMTSILVMLTSIFER